MFCKFAYKWHTHRLVLEKVDYRFFFRSASKFLLIEFWLFATATAAEQPATTAANEIVAQTRPPAIRQFSEIYTRTYVSWKSHAIRQVARVCTYKLNFRYYFVYTIKEKYKFVT